MKNLSPPYSIYIDFWSIGSSRNGLLLIYPSYGTRINKIRYMKSEENVQRLVDIFDTDEDSLQDIVFEAHADARNIRHSGIAITKLITMWIRVQKELY